LGSGNDSGGIAETVKKLALRQTYSGPPSSDPVSPQTQDEQMRAAQKMREGLNSAFGIKDRYGQISLRGTDGQLPVPPAPSGTPAPPANNGGDTIIPAAGAGLPTNDDGTHVTPEQDREQKRLEDLRRRGKIPNDAYGGVI
jgi:hypothetical protein